MAAPYASAFWVIAHIALLSVPPPEGGGCAAAADAAAARAALGEPF